MKSIVGRKTLTSKEAARLLGVSEASVKRWADGGLLAAEKTAGGHRRFRPETVAAFRRDNLARAGTPPSAPDAAKDGARAGARGHDAPDFEALSSAMFASLVAGHAEEASALLFNLTLRGHTIAAVADSVLCPAMRRVGDLWHAGALSVAEEHVATRAALAALQSLRGATRVKESKGLSAICCSVEDDFHELPVNIAAHVLEAEGFGAITLGASTPFYALAEAVQRFRPRLVCVASTVLVKLDRAAREYAEFRAAAGKAGAAVVLGGEGFAGETLRRRFPAELHADDFGQLETFAAALADDEV